MAIDASFRLVPKDSLIVLKAAPVYRNDVAKFALELEEKLKECLSHNNFVVVGLDDGIEMNVYPLPGDRKNYLKDMLKSQLATLNLLEPDLGCAACHRELVQGHCGACQ